MAMQRRLAAADVNLRRVLDLVRFHERNRRLPSSFLHLRAMLWCRT